MTTKNNLNAVDHWLGVAWGFKDGQVLFVTLALGAETGCFISGFYKIACVNIRPGSKKILFTVLMTCEAAGGEGKKIKMEKNKNLHPSVK